MAIRNTRAGQRYRRIVFTLNNWTQAEYDLLIQWDTTWMIIGKEVGEEGTPHLQGACILGRQYSKVQLKKVPGFERAHFEVMGGTPQHQVTYCSKQDPIPFIKGIMPEPGKRNDLEEAHAALVAGATLRTLAEEFGVAFIKYHKGLTACRSILAKSRTESPKVIWLCGPTGVGKTRCAVSIATDYYGGDYWLSNGTLQWVDGYDGQRVAIVDDFRAKHCSFSFLLRLLDRYTLRAPIKGGFVDWSPAVIFITAPYDPKTLFSVRDAHLPEDVKQIMRRLTKVIEIPLNGCHENVVKQVMNAIDPDDEILDSLDQDLGSIGE